MLTISPKSTTLQGTTHFKSYKNTPKSQIRIKTQVTQFNDSLRNSQKSQAVNLVFTDYHLAYRVRLSLLSVTATLSSQYQDNKFVGLLSEPTIHHILSFLCNLNKKVVEENIIGQIWKYDHNSDNLLTYDQFINFFIEVCFPMLSLSNLGNLHNQFKQRGIITQNQFIQALSTQLSLLKCEATVEELSCLFNEIIDKEDDYLTNQQYKQFISNYFGSTGYAGKYHKQFPIQNIFLLPIVNFQLYEKNLHRISKIVFSQLKAKIFDYDYEKDLTVSAQQIETLISRIFMKKIEFKENQKKNQFPYKEAMQIIIKNVFTDKTVIAAHTNLTSEGFVNKLFANQFRWLKIKPSKYLLEQIYDYLSTNSGEITLIQYHKFLHDLATVFGKNSKQSL